LTRFDSRPQIGHEVRAGVRIRTSGAIAPKQLIEPGFSISRASLFHWLLKLMIPLLRPASTSPSIDLFDHDHSIDPPQRGLAELLRWPRALQKAEYEIILTPNSCAKYTLAHSTALYALDTAGRARIEFPYDASVDETARGLRAILAAGT
jgi:hypothetical protein